LHAFVEIVRGYHARRTRCRGGTLLTLPTPVKGKFRFAGAVLGPGSESTRRSPVRDGAGRRERSDPMSPREPSLM